MDELLIRYLRKQTTADEDATVVAWLEGSPDNERALADLRRLVHVGRMADRRVVPGDPPSAEDVIWRAEARVARLAGRGEARLGRRLRPARPRPGLLGMAAAAAVVAVVGVGVWQVVIGFGGSGDATAGAQVFATSAGETEMVRLGDGSVIRLGPDSRLTAAGGSAREVTLHGEAFFAVAADAARPFSIVTAAGTARVLGTRFHLAAGADELTVTVVEGRVALAGPDHEVQVGAGQATSLLRGRPEPVEAAPPIETVAEWLGDFLIFHDTPLSVAMAEVRAHFATEVVISDEALLDRTLTMWFDAKSLEEVMTVVCSVVDARCSIGGGVVRMQSADGGEGS